MLLAGIALLLAIACVCIIYFAVLHGAFGKIPDESELAAITTSVATEVLSSDGVILGRYYTQRRSPVAFNEISPNIINALIATEDIRFFEHDGVDARSLLRVLVKSILLRQHAGGGSTLTQQLARNIYPREQTSSKLAIIPRKFKEFILARKMEKIYTKGEILTMYLNTVPFTYGNFGIKSACEYYFNTTPAEISPENAAVLVGMLRAPTVYNPKRSPERATQRRNVVLNQMAKYDLMPATVADSLKQLPIELTIVEQSHNDGPAGYFREQLRLELMQWARNNPKQDGSLHNIYTDGLKIYTSIHSTLQTYAEQAVHEHMKELQATFFKHWERKKPWDGDRGMLLNAIRSSPRYQGLKRQGLSEKAILAEMEKPIEMTIFTYDGEVTKTLSPIDSIKYYLMHLNTGFIAMHPQTGHVLAYVGGIDFEYFKYNHVLARRQVGSTFKPIVYAAALEQGFAPCDLIANDSIVYEEYDGWTPENVDGYGGWYSMKGALTKSMNVISVKLIIESGLYNVTRLAKKMGISSEIPPTPSIALGAADISLQEMVTAYGTFTNRGIAIEPRYLLRIEDAEGNLLADFTSTIKRQRVLTQQNADIMVHMLQSVVDSGTARRLRFRYGLKNAIGGKTGTTQHHSDGWFIGFTPNILAGAWVGGSDRRVRFRSIALGQGANTALPIWANFMTEVNNDPEFKAYRQASFPDPQVDSLTQLDCPLYLSEIERPVFANKEAYDQYKKSQRRRSKQNTESPAVIVRTSGTGAESENERFVDKLKGLFKRDKTRKRNKKQRN